MFQAKLHPEQYSNTFSDEQIKRLHDAIMYVCDTAVEVNAESDRFPGHWLMKHRWSKGKKDGSKLPTGEKITFLKVGGRTSAIVPSVQKKTAAVAGDVSDAEEEEKESKAKKGGKRKAKAVKEEEVEEQVVEAGTPVKPKRGRKKAEEVIKDEDDGETEKEKAPVAKKQKTATSAASKMGKKTQKVEVKSEDTSSQRRSARQGNSKVH